MSAVVQALLMVGAASGGALPTLAHLGDTGLRGGGTIPSGGPRTASIDYIAIPTTGDASSFGSLSSARGSGLAGGSNGTRGLFSGGGTGGGPTAVSTVDYVTIASSGSTASWGNLNTARHYCTGDSNGTYTMVGGGYTGSTELQSVERLVTATGASKTASRSTTSSMASNASNRSSCSPARVGSGRAASR